jgi:hypothetical protein
LSAITLSAEFEYDGTTWTREWNPVMSNTGSPLLTAPKSFVAQTAG